jgi:hypothetical protein
MHKRKRQHHTWAVEWEQVYQSDREERLQRVFAFIVPQTETRVRRQAGEKADAKARRPLRQSVQ